MCYTSPLPGNRELIFVNLANSQDREVYKVRLGDLKLIKFAGNRQLDVSC